MGHSHATGKNNGFPFLDILGYLKNTHKNPKFGRVGQVPIWELSWEFPAWDLSTQNMFVVKLDIGLQILVYHLDWIFNLFVNT